MENFDREPKYSFNNLFRNKQVFVVIIAINVIVHLLSILLGRVGLKDYLVFDKYLAVTGDFWRFFTCMFAHANLMHLFFNMFCLYIFGRFAERAFGQWRFIVIYIVSGLLGSAFSLMFSMNPSLGASGAVFGVVASNFYLIAKIPDSNMKKGFMTDIGGFLIINLIYSAINPGVDLAAHIGGALAGVMTGYALGSRYEDIREKSRKLKLVLAVVLAAILMAVPVFIRLSKIDVHYTAIALRYQTYSAKNALGATERALRRFPDDKNLKDLKYFLEEISN